MRYVSLLLVAVLGLSCKTTEEKQYDKYYEQLKESYPNASEETLQCALRVMRKLQKNFECELLEGFKETLVNCVQHNPEAVLIAVSLTRCGNPQ